MVLHRRCRIWRYNLVRPLHQVSPVEDGDCTASIMVSKIWRLHVDIPASARDSSVMPLIAAFVSSTVGCI